MQTSGEAKAPWNGRVVDDMLASVATQAVLFTDTNGRVVHSNIRRDVPPGIAQTLDCLLSAKSLVGQQLGLGQLRIGASLHDEGTVVWGQGVGHAVVVVSSSESNLGQLISQVRRVFDKDES